MGNRVGGVRAFSGGRGRDGRWYLSHWHNSLSPSISALAQSPAPLHRQRRPSISTQVRQTDRCTALKGKLSPPHVWSGLHLEVWAKLVPATLFQMNVLFCTTAATRESFKTGIHMNLKAATQVSLNKQQPLINQWLPTWSANRPLVLSFAQRPYSSHMAHMNY